MLDTLALLFFPALMAFAAFSDLFTMRISNRLVLTLIAGFALVAALMGMNWPEIGMHLLGAGAVLAVAFVFFSLGWIGGGDAKLTAATALWLGPALLTPYLVYSALLGGALTLAILFSRRLPLPAPFVRVEWIARLHHEQTGIPYGIALAAGALIVYSQSAIFFHFTG